MGSETAAHHRASTLQREASHSQIHSYPSHLQVQIREMSSPSSLTPDSPNKGFLLQVPSPIVTRRSRTKSTTEIANSNPEVKGKVKYFCRTKGHGFITPDDGGVDIFLHISDIEGEYIPLEGDEVTYRLCPIPPKREKYQATHVRIVNFTPEVHHRWDCLPSEGH